MELERAQEIASSLIAELGEVCDRIAVAGSVRRRKPDVKDIELCVIPSVEVGGGLFGDAKRNLLAEYLASYPFTWGRRIKGQPDGKYIQFALKEGINFDLFVCTPENWGLNYLIRTGSAAFSQAVLTRANRLHYHSEGARLRHDDGTVAETPEERSVFELLGLRYVEPEERTGAEKVSGRL